MQDPAKRRLLSSSCSCAEFFFDAIKFGLLIIYDIAGRNGYYLEKDEFLLKRC